MTAQEITLNIAVNLGRLARWVGEGKTRRVAQFMTETDEYLKLLESLEKSVKFEKTLKAFSKSFSRLKVNYQYDQIWAEEALTWSNILAHRAKLA